MPTASSCRRSTDLAEIRAIAEAVALPLNVLVMPDLAPVAELKRAGVRRVSAGSGIAAAAFGVTQRATKQFLETGRYETMFETRVDYGEMNKLLR